MPAESPTGSIEAETKLTHNVLDEAAAGKLLADLSEQVDRAVEPGARLILVGIRRRGDSIAAEIGRHLQASRGVVPIGSLDITLYRDDFGQVGALPLVGRTRIPESIDGAHVVIVDDVLHTGRTIRAALNELSDFGRARRIQLCVLVDRGGRQLPIQADFAGCTVSVEGHQDVAVRVADTDGSWGVDIVDLPPPPPNSREADGTEPNSAEADTPPSDDTGPDSAEADTPPAGSTGPNSREAEPPPAAETGNPAGPAR